MSARGTARAGIFSLGILLILQTGAGPAAAKPTFTVSQTGNPANVETNPSGGTVLLGGSPDVDAAFRWMLARSGGGDVVVIRASGSDGYNDYLFTLDGVVTPADSVTTIVFHERAAASNASLLNTVREAEALFIAESDYIRLWDDTPLETAIEERVRDGMVIGGASAGAMVLGEHDYTAARGSATSRAALRNPFDKRVMVSSGFLAVPDLEGVIVDTHVSERNRMGRLVACLARIAQRGETPVRGVGLDEGTALLIAPGGQGTIVGSGEVLFVDGQEKPQRCRRGRALTYRSLPGERAVEGDVFDLATWSGASLETNTFTASRGRLNVD